MPSHLPLLLNPLLNSIFNNPQPFKSPLKDVYTRLEKSQDDTIVILIPSLRILLNYYDKDTELSYSDLCYSENFVSDHILLTKEQSNVRMFTTFSNKEVLVKKDVLFTGKGFKKSLRCKIVKYDIFQNFNDYFEKGKKFQLIYIEGPLFGTPLESKTFKLMAPSSNKAENVIIKDLPSETLDDEEHKDFPHEDTAIQVEQEQLKFEQIIRSFPLVSKNVGEKFEYLFRNFSTKEVPDLDSLIQTFSQATNLSTHIFQTLNSDIVDSILEHSPNLDLNECLYTYVELNLYDKIWNKLCDINVDFLSPHYTSLESLSLNQGSLPSETAIDLEVLAILQKRCHKAISVFKKLDLTTDSVSKVNVLVETISLLSNIEGVVIDADTLVGLLLVVVVHSAIANLESHLLYIQNFYYQETDLGLVGYSLSTLEAVLYHLKDPENLKILKKHSESNKTVLSKIYTKELIYLKKLADSFDTNDYESCLKSKTANGESLLMLAIQSNDYDTWKLLIDYENIYPLEDILYDVTVFDVNLFNNALVSENFEIIDDLFDTLLASCSDDELVSYFNYKDLHYRTIGHYLFHYKDLIPRIGPFIDWKAKDLNGQTPLFAICRSYDTPNYERLIMEVFETVDTWYKDNGSEFDYEDHIDNRGNTLLHIMDSNIDLLLKYDRQNINEQNDRSYTPLMIYSKYNRVQNIRHLLKHELLDITKTDKNSFSCVDLSKNQAVADLIEVAYLDEKVQQISGKQIGIVRVILENGAWKLVLRGKLGSQKHTVFHSFSDFKTLIEILQIESPNSFLPFAHILKDFDLTLNIPSFNKLKLNKIIDQMNLVLQSLLLNRRLIEHEVLWEFLASPDFNSTKLIQRSRLRALAYKNDLLKVPSQLNKEPSNGREFQTLQPEEISEINFFLKFSSKEMSTLRNLYEKLFKVVEFKCIKQKELNDSCILFSSENQVFLNEFLFLRSCFGNLTREFKMDEDVCNYILYLSRSSDEFVANINNLMNKKIFKWWKLYGELIELNKSYKRLKFVESKKLNKNENLEIQGIVDVNEQSFEDLTTSTSFSGTTEGLKKKQTPSFLANFIESKRHKYETKLLDSLNDVKRSLIELSREIKFNHETIAMELNNFMTFKTEFLKLTLKSHVKKEIKSLKFRNYMLRRSLDDIRYVKSLI